MIELVTRAGQEAQGTALFPEPFLQFLHLEQDDPVHDFIGREKRNRAGSASGPAAVGRMMQVHAALIHPSSSSPLRARRSVSRPTPRRFLRRISPGNMPLKLSEPICSLSART